MFRIPDNLETDLEDLLPERIYVDAFNAAYAKELKGANLTLSDLRPHRRIVQRINQWLEEKGIILLKDGGFNHYRVAQALLPKLTDTTLSTTDVERFEKLFARVNLGLGRGNPVAAP